VNYQIKDFRLIQKGIIVLIPILVIIKDMNHILKNSSSDVKANIATYSNPNMPLAKALVPVIISFVRQIDEKNERSGYSH
jgi:hypothetical protein